MFKLSLSKNQIAILLAFLYNQDKIGRKEWSIRDLSEILGINHETGLLYQYTDWLLAERVLIPVGEREIIRPMRIGHREFTVKVYKVDFYRIAVLLFNKYETRILFDLAHEYIDRPE